MIHSVYFIGGPQDGLQELRDLRDPLPEFIAVNELISCVHSLTHFYLIVPRPMAGVSAIHQPARTQELILPQ
jgi:hypothetical protein